MVHDYPRKKKSKRGKAPALYPRKIRVKGHYRKRKWIKAHYRNK